MKDKTEDLGYAGLKFIQREDVFKFGTDAVLLASFIELHTGERFIEFGTGSGIIPVLLSGRVKTEMIGIEVQETAALLAKENMALNELSHVKIIKGDVKEVAGKIEGHIDVIATNPPYDMVEAGQMSKKEHIRIARHEVQITLEEIIFQAARLLKDGGRFYMIHKAERLVDICSYMRRYKLEPKMLRLVAKKEGEAPTFLLIKGVKSARKGIKLAAPLVLYHEDGSYTPELREIYHMEEA